MIQLQCCDGCSCSVVCSVGARDGVVEKSLNRSCDFVCAPVCCDQVTNNCGPAITHLQTAALNALTPALNRFSPNPALNESVPLNNILHESKFSDPQPSANAVPDPVDVDNNGKEKVA